MTDNRTSEAVTRLAVVSNLDVPIYCSQDKAAELFAICEKYKRMEKALKKYRSAARKAVRTHESPHDESCPMCILQKADAQAEEALAFDPLSSFLPRT